MSFIYRDRNADDYLIGNPWMNHPRKHERVCVVCVHSEDVDKNGMTKEDRNLENFCAGGL